MTSDRFFIVYQKGKCHRQVIGKHKISETPNTIALFLNLPEPERYTGHSFRRSAATILSNSGANLVAVKSLGGWKSDSVAQGYIDNSVKMKRKIFNDITGIVEPNAATGSVNGTSKVGFDKPCCSTDQAACSTSNASSIKNESTRSSIAPKKMFVQQPCTENELENDSNENVLNKRMKMSKDVSSVCENEALNEIDLNSSYVKFHNCQINQLTINNSTCSNKSKKGTN